MMRSAMKRTEVCLRVGDEELIVTGDVRLPAVVSGPSLRGGEVTITRIRLDGPPSDRPEWTGTLSDRDEERAKDDLMEEACYRDMRDA